MLKFYFLVIFYVPLAIALSSNRLATSVRDTSTGLWVPNITVELYNSSDGGETWNLILQTITDSSGKIPSVVADDDFPVGNYSLKYYTKPYYDSNSIATFYPYTEVQFEKIGSDIGKIMLVPMMIAPYGFSSYRGSLLS